MGRSSFSFPPFKAAVRRSPGGNGFLFHLWWNGRALFSETWEGISEDCALNRAWAMMEDLADDMATLRNALSLADRLVAQERGKR